MRPCEVSGKAAGCPSWDRAGNASAGRDGAVPGAPRSPRAAAGCQLPASEPAARYAGSACPAPGLSQRRNSRPHCSLEIVLPGSLLGNRGGVGRQLRRCRGRPAHPFARRGGSSVPGHGARETPAFPLGFSCEEGGTLPRGWALEPRMRAEGRAGLSSSAPGRPESATRRWQAVIPDPSPHRDRSGNVFPAACWWVSVPRFLRQLSRALGAAPLPLRSGCRSWGFGAPERRQPRGYPQRGDILSGAAEMPDASGLG